MAIRDLFWACPICGREGGLRSARRGAERCEGCATRFSRGRGAAITARTLGRAPLTLSPADWVDRLPELGVDERIRRAEETGTAILSEPAVVRCQVNETPVYFRGRFLNLIERFGPPRTGVLGLYPDRVTFRPDEPAEGEGAVAAGTLSWPFDEITAVQPSSSTLQLNSRRLPLASFKIPGGSIKFWEELLCATLARYYEANGLGEIIEFQPRIVTRRTP